MPLYCHATYRHHDYEIEGRANLFQAKSSATNLVHDTIRLSQCTYSRGTLSSHAKTLLSPPAGNILPIQKVSI